MPSYIKRSERIRQIQRQLGRRKLIWFGTRGADCLPLLDLSQFAEVYSIITPLNSLSVEEVCLENLSGSRVDLDSYRLEYDTTESVKILRKRLFRLFFRVL